MISDCQPNDIAIIGMSALFPGAKGLDAYWHNILHLVNHTNDAPTKWIGSYFDPNSEDMERIYTRKVGLIGDIAEFNPLEFGILPNSVDGGEPDQFLALQLAQEALKDAGYTERLFNSEKTGIILGRGATPNRGSATGLQYGLVLDQTMNLLAQLLPNMDADTLVEVRQALKASLPPLPKETAPGLVSNVASGRIANRLNLMGPNYMIDAACASSLIAVGLAIKELLSGRCDMMLAGGVQASMPPQVYMLFCQLGALSPSGIQPFAQSANGTLLSEGVGFLVLKRLSTAQQDGDRIYAVLKGVGVASDGKALGLLTPRLEGEILAIESAYAESQIDPATIGLIEAHGTGIPLGDQTEIQALSHCFGQRRGQLPDCAIGSVKSLIGHCIPAAGIASLIKTTLALYHRVLPPTLCSQVNPDLELEKTPFYVNTSVRPWIHGNPTVPRRAGVNAFGFGGINAHVILEEYTEPQHHPLQHLDRHWQTELLIFSGEGHSALMALLQQVLKWLESHSDFSLAELAYTLSSYKLGSHRLAIVAQDMADLQTKLSRAAQKLADPNCKRFQTRSGIYYAPPDCHSRAGKTAFLFPGEGSQYRGMLADLCLYFPKVRAWFDFSDQTFVGIWDLLPSQLIFPPPTALTNAEQSLLSDRLFTMDVATETVFTASMALSELLQDFGVQCDFMVGHSTGEHTALVASGVFQSNEMAEIKAMKLQLNQNYREMEAADGVPKGALLTVGAVHTAVLNQIVAQAPGRLYIAMDNCPNQVVLFGSEADIDRVAVQLQQQGGICTRLPFDRAYHTPLFESMTSSLEDYYQNLNVGPGHTTLYSCINCQPFPSEPEAIRTLAKQQWSSAVRFRDTIETLYNEEVRTFIEVGPSGNLTAFVEDILRGREHQAIASNSQRKSGLEQIQHLLARLLVNGHTVNLTPLYAQRQLNLLSLDTADLPKAPAPLLNLLMPKMELKPEFVHQLQEKLQAIAPTSTTPTAAPLVEEIASDVKTQIAPTSTTPNEVVPMPAPIADYGEPILHAHLELMSEFLASQARIATEFYTHISDSSDIQLPP